jgi:hypothetical protein
VLQDDPSLPTNTAAFIVVTSDDSDPERPAGFGTARVGFVDRFSTEYATRRARPGEGCPAVRPEHDEVGFLRSLERSDRERLRNSICGTPAVESSDVEPARSERMNRSRAPGRADSVEPRRRRQQWIAWILAPNASRGCAVEREQAVLEVDRGEDPAIGETGS